MSVTSQQCFWPTDNVDHFILKNKMLTFISSCSPVLQNPFTLYWKKGKNHQSKWWCFSHWTLLAELFLQLGFTHISTVVSLQYFYHDQSLIVWVLHLFTSHTYSFCCYIIRCQYVNRFGTYTTILLLLILYKTLYSTITKEANCCNGWLRFSLK